MPATLFCTEKAPESFDCRLIVDGRKEAEWTPKKVEIISEQGREIDTNIETDTKSLIATTDDYFNCEIKDGKLKCVGSTRYVASREEAGEKWVERLAERFEV